ncbi:MAG: hypothetical protein JWM64_363 [Frankiales bacterium]|nr:hypothetical protein [Frankiales bacterium]
MTAVQQTEDKAVRAAAVVQRVADDLQDETTAIVSVLAGLREERWDAPTPAVGWSIRDQVTHLAYFDDATLLALTDVPAFLAQRDELLALGVGFPDAVAERHRALSPSACLDWFTRSRRRLLEAYRSTDPAYRLPWYGPDMGLASSATGRLMETWAHGQDVVDTVGLVRPSTARLRSVADLGIRTFAFAFALNGKPAPTSPVRVELQGPGGELWSWGPEDAADRVTGDALDFCLVVTQRRNLLDTALQVTGPVATDWMSVAQAYAGGAGAGRPPGMFPGVSR